MNGPAPLVMRTYIRPLGGHCASISEQPKMLSLTNVLVVLIAGCAVSIACCNDGYSPYIGRPAWPFFYNEPQWPRPYYNRPLQNNYVHPGIIIIHFNLLDHYDEGANNFTRQVTTML